MDYKTKPISKRKLRRFARIMRHVFGEKKTGPFHVLNALEKVGDVFKGCNYVVVEDKYMPPKTMARCFQNDLGGYTIEIKQSVYDGAYEKKIGAYLGFICHELCHVFLFYIGYTPIFERSFKDNVLPAFCSVEWQAKYLCNEVMIPHHESAGMSVNEMIKKYHCSKAFAECRLNQSKKEKEQSNNAKFK